MSGQFATSYHECVVSRRALVSSSYLQVLLGNDGPPWDLDTLGKDARAAAAPPPAAGSGSGGGLILFGQVSGPLAMVLGLFRPENRQLLHLL